jgi:signal transduction histidine kinase
MQCPLVGGMGKDLAVLCVPGLSHFSVDFSFVQSLSVRNGWWIVPFVFASIFGAIYLATGWRKQQEFRLRAVRSRIATDLHDDIGSSLSQVVIMCEVLSRQSLNEKEALQEIAGVSRNVLSSMSEIVWAVDPSHDHLRDLTQRMRWFAGETLAGSGLSLDFTAIEPASEVRLEPETRRQIFLIFKECVHNIVRHASAGRARILLRVCDDQLALVIEDDGIGFDPKRAVDGNGMRNIRHRARLLQASLDTRSIIGRGTVLTLRVPLMTSTKDWRRHLPKQAHKHAAGM